MYPRCLSKTWPNFNGRPSKGVNNQGGYLEMLKRPIFNSRSTIFKDRDQDAIVPGRSDRK
jgi:hypothetical protein